MFEVILVSLHDLYIVTDLNPRFTKKRDYKLPDTHNAGHDIVICFVLAELVAASFPFISRNSSGMNNGTINKQIFLSLKAQGSLNFSLSIFNDIPLMRIYYVT